MKTSLTPNIRFQVITDTHVVADPLGTYSIHFDHALQDIRATAPDSDGIMHIGDITDSGKLEEYETMGKIWAKNRAGLAPMYFSYGNHDVRWADFEERMNRFTATTGIDQKYYDVWIRGYHFIFLGTEKGLKDSSFLSEMQLTWLEHQLSEQEALHHPVFIFVHEPLKNTVAGSQNRFGWHGIRQDRELKWILSKYPQSILFTGHTHWELGAQDTMYQTKYATMFNAGSVGYLWTDDDELKEGSQGFYVEVYDDKVLVKGRDFKHHSWIYEAQYVIHLPVQIPLVNPDTDPDLSLGNPTMKLDKSRYLSHEAIHITYTGSLGEDAFGIFPRDSMPHEVHQIVPIAFIQTHTVRQPDGELTFESMNLSIGSYDMIYLGETLHTELMRIPFDVVAE
ncbi:hypothetical protein BVG16_21320 [Paenibacillus selenitireducens]|uniref:Calcineurin-like phosphoesterase domain-containing protein n=1 Tax=Paenibacillus selenitireducens TaxID=1324314 RepID=A0A1T2X5H2_9BACL|nr:metallophosphoesterase [Paenibacillus selenitireducens]OPA75151.1 hypothetical protein BVG16_21320 [Paenibacillus selenitireducens]